jgi:hypothetical protein
VSQDPLWYKDAVFYELHVKASTPEFSCERAITIAP